MTNIVHNIWSVPIWSSFIKQDSDWLDAAKNLEYERMYSKNYETNDTFHSSFSS